MRKATSDPFGLRLNEAEIARLLRLIAKLPNKREEPVTGDTAGKFDFWFDGGACSHHTGVQEFVFHCGARAWVGTLPWLSVDIEFSDGRRVKIEQAKG